MVVGQRTLLAAVAVFGACIGPDTPTCDGLVCPTDKVCDPHRVTCVLPSQVAACTSMPDATACVFPGETDGVCDHGVCFASECGDGLVSANEVCDDANSVDGDGCSAFCLSEETCGNGIVDVAVGESCDDGDLRSGDGCSSGCTAEVASWHELKLGDYPGEYAALAVYDSARSRIVQFGGTSPTGQPVDELEELHAGQWERIQRTVRPPPRNAHVMAYDAARRATVVFGGNGPSGALADTWTYDGRWHALAIPNGPDPRTGAAGAYDAEHREVVMFGGETADGLVDETWVLTGSTWVKKGVTGPSPRRDHLMAYDPARRVVVLFGGTDASGKVHDTWEWDGSAWTPVTTATDEPFARGAMAYDVERGSMVLVAGDDQWNSSAWELFAGKWNLLGVQGFSLRRRPALAYDPVGGSLVIHGGTELSVGMNGPPLNDTWRYASGMWKPDSSVEPHAPPKRELAGFAYDRVRARIVLAAGFTPSDISDSDTWTYDGVQWVEGASTPAWGGCPARSCPSEAVEIPGTGTLLLVRSVGMQPLQTWKFDGATWTQVAVTSSPPPRARFALTYDRARGVVVLVGGTSGSNVLDDVWELSNNAWVNRTAAFVVRPPPRSAASLAYDTVRKTSVLFGGLDAENHPLGDTWLYDGTAWTRQPLSNDLEGTPVTPMARSGAALAFHEARGRTILFGGDTMGGSVSDTWELNAAGWSPITVFEGPGPRTSPALAYDANRKLIVLHGGDPENDTWELVFRSTLPDEKCDHTGDEDDDGLADCADPDCLDSPCGDGQLCGPGGACVCANDHELRCGDGTDDDCDGAIDCADSECAQDPACLACAASPTCEVYETTCNDNVDNDGDGRTDCQDPDCFLNGCALVLP